MEKDQLISMMHFLVKREVERAQENHERTDMSLGLSKNYQNVLLAWMSKLTVYI